MQVQFGASPRHVGEIVLFERQGKVVAHRVIGVKAGVLLTKGDSLSYFDSPVQEAEVLGVVRARRTASGRTSFGCRGRSAHFAALLSGLHGRITGRLRAGRDHP
jgi:hypothetical protein